MGQDYPDYFGQSIFPKFGATYLSSLDTVAVPDGSTKYVADLTLKSVITGGYMRLFGNADVNNQYIKLIIDGQDAAPISVGYFWNYTGGLKTGHPLSFVIYDDVAHIYVISLSGDLSFESTLKFGILNETGSPIIFTGLIFYYRVV